ncbi:hypothetical protein HGRIS_010392 [Hohenbuehelia grisea]|uniref:Uncharacterized protein n=1 Tax=Hohenbuehelia grisea TaxID=104357 RepID=A0ABR3J471_9AGAR
MRSAVASTLVLALCASAIQITKPSQRNGWTTAASQEAEWQHVSTDPDSFTAVLSNQVETARLGNYNQTLAAEVDATTGRTNLGAPSGGWPTGKGFRLDFWRAGAILAQSEQFEITVSSSSSVSSTLSTGPTPVVSGSGSTLVIPASNTGSAAAANPSSSEASSPPRNGASTTGVSTAVLGFFAALSFLAI